MQYKVTNCVHAEHVYQIVCVEHISLRLAHLAIALQEPRMAEYLLRQRQIQCHQENGPVDGMEADDILTDQMQIRRPFLLKQVAGLSVALVADTGDIVGQRVQPYVYYVLRVEIHRDTPFEGGTRYAEILQTRKQEVVHHLILSGNRLDEFRMLVDVVNQTVSVFAHTEEISLFLSRLHLAAAVRTLAVHQLGLGPEGLAGSTVHTLVSTLVDIALVIQLLENLLYLLLVVIICGTDKFIIGSVHQIPDSLNLAGHIVHEFLRSNACFLGLQLNLLAVFVRTGLKEYVVALESAETGNGVRQYNLIGVADVGLAGCVGNGRGHVKLFLFHFLPLFSLQTKDQKTPSSLYLKEDGDDSRVTTSVHRILANPASAGTCIP